MATTSAPTGTSAFKTKFRSLSVMVPLRREYIIYRPSGENSATCAVCVRNGRAGQDRAFARPPQSTPTTSLPSDMFSPQEETQIMSITVQNLHQQLKKRFVYMDSDSNGTYTGTTALLVWVYEDANKRAHIVCANVGDSSLHGVFEYTAGTEKKYLYKKFVEEANLASEQEARRLYEIFGETVTITIPKFQADKKDFLQNSSFQGTYNDLANEIVAAKKLLGSPNKEERDTAERYLEALQTLRIGSYNITRLLANDSTPGISSEPLITSDIIDPNVRFVLFAGSDGIMSAGKIKPEDFIDQAKLLLSGNGTVATAAAAATVSTTAEAVANTLIDQALRAGSKDDISLVVLTKDELQRTTSKELLIGDFDANGEMGKYTSGVDDPEAPSASKMMYDEACSSFIQARQVVLNRRQAKREHEGPDSSASTSPKTKAKPDDCAAQTSTLSMAK
jgi:serine/threonine protein phosphatase PrpC